MALDLQKTIDTQTGANQGGMTPKDAFGPVKSAVQSTTPISPTREVEMISTERGKKAVQQKQDELTQLEGDKETQRKLLETAKQAREKLRSQLDAKKTEKEEGKTTFIDADGRERTVTGSITDAQRKKMEADGFTEAESSITEDPEVAAARKEYELAAKNTENFMDDLYSQAISSSELRDTFDSIRRVYDARINAMEEINRRRVQTLETMGVRLGSRYTGGVFGGIVTEEERQGAQRISELEAEKQNEIENAKQAAREFNFSVFSDAVNKAKEIEKEKLSAFQELKELAMEQEQEAKDEQEKIEQQALTVEQINLGLTDPVEIFSALEGNVPWDVVKEITDTLPESEEKEFEFKTGSKYQPAGTFDPSTGEFVPLAGATALATGGSVAGTGGVGIQDFPTNADLERMSTDERDFVNKVMRQLPTKLKDSEQEKKDRMKEALFDYRRGRDIQEVVDELNGFVVQNKTDQSLANVFRSYAVGSGVELSEISAAVNNNNPEQAMTTVENAKLADADQFFGSIDQARNVVKLSDTILSLLEETPTGKLGAFDGRKFKVGRFAGLTNSEMQKVQQLETALATLNSPTRVALIGTAGTEQEMAKITALQADILDQPEIIKTIVEQFRDGVVDIHNEARSQRGLPTVDKQQLTDNQKRLDLYKSKANVSEQYKYEGMSNLDLMTNTPANSFGGQTSSTWSLIGI